MGLKGRRATTLGLCCANDGESNEESGAVLAMVCDEGEAVDCGGTL